ncbi:hypothetical protein PLEOSDRAFT_158952 [Pleurotus ostreatus PC15]|uniref:Uncharacterized protein n=1 Tax=Pleurotus ostreatus (strain PC15) TaxID=1137138 RepID=A0A067NGZ2_PLEO1|nr:hypothetical protein PLEOSDRAFT_158952 [Pleurotus ostreatus PC15]
MAATYHDSCNKQSREFDLVPLRRVLTSSSSSGEPVSLPGVEFERTKVPQISLEPAFLPLHLEPTEERNIGEIYQCSHWTEWNVFNENLMEHTLTDMWGIEDGGHVPTSRSRVAETAAPELESQQAQSFESTFAVSEARTITVQEREEIVSHPFTHFDNPTASIPTTCTKDAHTAAARTERSLPSNFVHPNGHS